MEEIKRHKSGCEEEATEGEDGALQRRRNNFNNGNEIKDGSSRKIKMIKMMITIITMMIGTDINRYQYLLH